MFKLSAIIGMLALVCSSWLSGTTLPRFTEGPIDYVLMPLLGYILIIIAAQVAARVTPHSES